MTEKAFCPHHPAAEAVTVCARCRKSFCPDCVIEFRGAVYCGACKNQIVRLAQTSTDYKVPMEALIWALVGYACCCFLDIVAIVRASQALSDIRRNPSLPGKGMAISAMVIAIAHLVLSVVGGILWVFLNAYQAGAMR